MNKNMLKMMLLAVVASVAMASQAEAAHVNVRMDRAAACVDRHHAPRHGARCHDFRRECRCSHCRREAERRHEAHLRRMARLRRHHCCH